ncbi:MAG: DUF4293 domain-containing protein [Bacteroidia bacterium]
MIQRIQSIYLLLVIAISGLLFIPPAAPISFVKSATSNEFDIVLNLFSLKTRCVSIDQPVYYMSLIIFNSLIILFALFALLKFKQRPLQVRLCYFNMLLVLLLFGCMYMFTDMMKHKTANPSVIYLLGFYLPPLQIILLFLAAKAINKDEKLVRSADRLR